MNISKKKETKIYELITNDIIDARIKISKMDASNRLLTEIDNILYKISLYTPEKVIEEIKKSKPKS